MLGILHYPSKKKERRYWTCWRYWCSIGWLFWRIRSSKLLLFPIFSQQPRSSLVIGCQSSFNIAAKLAENRGLKGFNYLVGVSSLSIESDLCWLICINSFVFTGKRLVSVFIRDSWDWEVFRIIRNHCFQSIFLPRFFLLMLASWYFFISMLTSWY